MNKLQNASSLPLGVAFVPTGTGYRTGGGNSGGDSRGANCTGNFNAPVRASRGPATAGLR
ncbi:hypothetical protein [Kamptonema formosum]|uniref:hypothetical protein n=1 Tax=Kamptonema formosum TaxID=331992 RepID=UPI0012DE537C|nr:hypothetical protein [Oscillatoria sp. PCC 10802]